jgi:hypothetical protein
MEADHDSSIDVEPLARLEFEGMTLVIGGPPPDLDTPLASPVASSGEWQQGPMALM